MDSYIYFIGQTSSRWGLKTWATSSIVPLHITTASDLSTFIGSPNTAVYFLKPEQVQANVFSPDGDTVVVRSEWIRAAYLHQVQKDLKVGKQMTEEVVEGYEKCWIKVV